MGKSLSEEISSLYAPKKDYDIENEDAQIGDVFEHEEGSEDSDEELKTDHYVNTSKSKLRQNEVKLGGKYKGDVISRDDLYGSDGEVNQSSEDSDEESEEELIEDDESQEDDLEEDQEEDQEENQEEEDHEDEQEGDEDSDSHSVTSQNQDESHKRSIIKNLMDKERTHIINRLSQSTINDALKGYAIVQQNKIFEKIINARLSFQKSLNQSNKLPISQAVYQENKTEQTSSLIKESKNELYSLLDSVINLRNELSETTYKPKKRTYQEYLETNAKQNQELSVNSKKTLQKWSVKVLNSSGSNAINKFKSINQSFDQQVENNLLDMDRLIKRTRLNRKNITPLGYVEPAQQEEVRHKTQPSNEYIFDDEDFYRTLLNDLVDRKIASNQEITLVKNVQRSNKIKNNVDTKASKGRKLRFQVQDQLANFETSIGSWKWNDDQIDEFFASLLGQKVNMNEEEDDEGDEDDADDDEIVNDGIQLFG